jgi:hypothetical protein
MLSSFLMIFSETPIYGKEGKTPFLPCNKKGKALAGKIRKQ